MLANAGHLSPGHEAQPVRPVVPARIFDLLMLARAVEAHRLRKLDVAAQVVARRRRHEAAGKVALVDHEPLDVWSAVEPEPAVAHLDLTQPEIAFDAVDLTTVMCKGHLEVVQVRSLRTPSMNGIEHDGAATFAPSDLATVESRHGFSLASSIDLDVNGSPIQMRCQPKALDRSRRQRLQPNRLPDPTGRGVEDPLRRGGPVLFAAGEGLVGQQV